MTETNWSLSGCDHCDNIIPTSTCHPTTMSKLSGSTTQETHTFLHMIENFKQTFDEEDKDDKLVISSLICLDENFK